MELGARSFLCAFLAICNCVSHYSIRPIIFLKGEDLSTNQRAIVDNATLSGVERLLGISQIRNLRYVDNDIACLEKLLTAILFSDEIIGIDDYKDEYRANRLKKFAFIDFLEIDDKLYAEHSRKAAEFAHEMTFSIENAKPAGDVVSFFEALRLDPQLRWNVFVSSEYLTLTFLTASRWDKHHELVADTFFRSEETDAKLVGTATNFQPKLAISERSEIQDIKDLVQAFADENPNYVSEDGKSALTRASFGYGWAAERSFFYNSIAHTEGANAYLAPLRDAFCESCCRIDYPSQTVGLLKSLTENTQRALASILTPTGQAHIALRLPFFTSYLISQVDTPQQCIERALELRNMKDFQECRTIFHNLSFLSAQDQTAELNQILPYLDQSCTNLMKKYGISTNGGLQYSLSLGLTGPSIATEGKLSQLFRAHKNRPFTRVFRNIAQDMLNVERMGELHDKICSSIRKHKDPTYSDVSTTPKFMENRENEFGRPAKL